jgi:hypothetical protein
LFCKRIEPEAFQSLNMGMPPYTAVHEFH